MSNTQHTTPATDEQRQNQTRTRTRTRTHTLDVTATTARTATRPPYNCPRCDRPTLSPTPDEIVTFQCGACGTRIDERGGDR